MSNHGIYSRVFDSVGTEVVAEYKCNASTSLEQREPDVAALAGGGYVVVWTTNHSGNYDIWRKSYNNAGTQQVADVRVNSATSGSQLNARVAGLTGGGYVVCWDSDDSTQDGSSTVTFCSVYNSAGSAVASAADSR